MHKRRVSNTKILSRSQHVEVIHLVLVAHDVALDLAGVDPGHKVLHVASDEVGRVVDDFRSNADVALFDECSRLAPPISSILPFCARL